MLTDTHAHIHFDDFSGDLADVFSNARTSQVGAIITVGTTPQDSLKALDFVMNPDVIALAHGIKLYATAGIHPHEASLGSDGLKVIEQLARNGKYQGVLVAVGECGLDYYRNNSPQAQQHEALEFQLQLAQELELESYFFALSKYANQLEEMIESGELKIVPQKRRNEMLGFLRSGLEDISISRPKSQLEWGIEVPNDPDHVMYVWFDALSNYISAIGYENDSQKFERFWPANVHVVGKDIARFHCLVWPAMLLSAGLETPKAVFVHSFITSGGQKMSKSLGNVIDPVDYANSYGVDALRYYLLRFIPSYNDGDFSLDRFEEVYNADLANNLGNLVSRVAAMLVKYNDGKYDIVSPKTEIDISGLVAEFRFDKCLEQIFARLDSLNVAIDTNKPWELAKTNPVKAVEFLSAMAGELTQVANSLAPFLPETSQKILAVFDAGKIAPSPQVLFPRID